MERAVTGIIIGLVVLPLPISFQRSIHAHTPRFSNSRLFSLHYDLVGMQGGRSMRSRAKQKKAVLQTMAPDASVYQSRGTSGGLELEPDPGCELILGSAWKTACHAIQVDPPQYRRNHQLDS